MTRTGPMLRLTVLALLAVGCGWSSDVTRPGDSPHPEAAQVTVVARPCSLPDPLPGVRGSPPVDAVSLDSLRSRGTRLLCPGYLPADFQFFAGGILGGEIQLIYGRLGTGDGARLTVTLFPTGRSLEPSGEKVMVGPNIGYLSVGNVGHGISVKEGETVTTLKSYEEARASFFVVTEQDGTVVRIWGSNGTCVVPNCFKWSVDEIMKVAASLASL